MSKIEAKVKLCILKCYLWNPRGVCRFLGPRLPDVFSMSADTPGLREQAKLQAHGWDRVALK